MIYEPQEDSMLLREQVLKFARGNVLDMGTGSGIQAIAAATIPSVSFVLAVDVDSSAIAHCEKHAKNPKIKYLESNLFERVRKGSLFDTISFNPPYLPRDEFPADIALVGGVRGDEVLRRFLARAPDFLSTEGKILLVVSSRSQTPMKDVLDDLLLVGEVASKVHIFFEDVFVYCITKTALLQELHEKKVRSVSYLAKGKRGVVFQGSFRAKKVAIKTVLQESKAVSTLLKERNILETVNRIGIGPKMQRIDIQDAVVMQFVNGIEFGKFLKDCSFPSLKHVLNRIMQQCRLLDNAGITKEEMHHPWKNILVGDKGKVTLLDFERSHHTEKPRNVSQFWQCVRNVAAIRNIRVSNKKWLSLAKHYSKKKTRENFSNMLSFIRCLRRN